MKKILTKFPLLRRWLHYALAVTRIRRTSETVANLAARLASLEDTITYFEYRIDKVHQNIASFLPKSSLIPPKTASKESHPCLVCASSSYSYLNIADYQYFRCSNCNHIFIPTAFESHFGKEFYNSNEYWMIENQWSKEERLHLISLIAKHFDHGDSIVDYGCGGNDIKEKRKMFPKAVFYDPFFKSPEIVNDISQVSSSNAHIVLTTEVFEHLFHPNAAITEILRILAPDGTIYMTTLLSDYKFDLNYIHPSKGHVSIFSLASIQTLSKMHSLTWEVVPFDEDRRYYMHRIRRKMK